MRAIIYTRVSTDEQADSGAGQNAQLDACRAWAARNGASIVSEHFDAVSGSVGIVGRPQLDAAIKSLRKGDVLLVHKLDRLSRGEPMVTVWIEMEVEKKGARIVSTAGEGTEGNDSSSVFMRRISYAIAENERLKVRERTKAALQAKKRRGERMGQIAYGFTAQGNRLIPSEDQQSVIHRMQVLRSKGESFRAIAKMLNTDGVPSPNAGRRVCSGLWSGESVRGILAANPGVAECASPV